MKIYLLIDQNCLGDKNQLIGIQQAIQANLKGQKCEFQHIEEHHFNVEILLKEDFVFVSGCHGLIVAEKIKKNSPNHKILWSGHQYFSKLDSIQYLPDIVALPATAVTENQKTKLMEKTQLISTSGVAHCVNNNTVEAEHARFKEELPDSINFPNQVGIILAGDAEGLDEKMKYFTEDDARQQASRIAKYLENIYDQKDTAIMITNGPRTGKYDSNTQSLRIPDPHFTDSHDSVSNAFLETFCQTIKNSKIFFYHFQYDKLKNSSSAYKPMIKQVADSKAGLWFVPSESTSMVTESSFLSEKGKQVVIYHPSSENSGHLAHATDIVANGFALDINDIESCQISKTSIKSAATQIAEAFCKIILPKDLISSFFGSKNQSGNPMELNERRHYCGY